MSKRWPISCVLLSSLLSSLACSQPAAESAPAQREAAPAVEQPVEAPPVAASVSWQQRAQAALDEAGVPGAIVVIDLEHGGALTSVERAGRVAHPATAARSPGSVVKPFLAVAALHEHVVDPREVINCDGQREIDGQTFTCFHVHGPQTLGQALSTSCNSYAYEIATRVGQPRLREHFLAFGLGDEPGGHVVLDESSTAAAAAVMGVGHGQLLISPVQLAHAYAALATGVAPAGHETTWAYESELATVREAMLGVVQSEQGTARAAAVPGLTILGKTGTTDDGDGQAAYRLAYFAGWAPADDPKLVVVVALETDEGTGGDTAAPVAQRLFASLSGG